MPHAPLVRLLDVKFTQNAFFLAIFVFEFCIKNYGLTPRGYWTDKFNAFDGTVVLVSLVFLFIPGGALAGLFRIGRVFRLLKKAPQLRALMVTMLSTFPAIANVMAVLLLLFFVYAVIGVQLFGKMRFGSQITQVVNFRNWQMAMLVLWRCSLGNWRGLMYDTMVQEPSCTVIPAAPGDGDELNDCGNYYMAVLYFVSFQIASTFCVLNLVIGIILGAFTWCYSLEPSEITGNLKISAQHLRHCKMIWDRFDPYGTGLIPVGELQRFLAVLRHCCPNMFSTGVRDMHDQVVYKDCSSFGNGPGGSDLNAGEQAARANYIKLIDKLKRYERSSWLWKQLEAQRIDVATGANDLIIDFDHHTMNPELSCNHIFTAAVETDVIRAPEYQYNAWNVPAAGTVEARMTADEYRENYMSQSIADTELLNVRFLSLVTCIVMEPLCIEDHDLYMCFLGRDPFNHYMPGYFGHQLAA